MAGSGTVSLTAQSILAEALEEAGRSRFDDDSFVEPMLALLHSLEGEAGLNAAGRDTMRKRVVGLLVNRARTEEHLERFPEIRDEEIVAPFVIVGLPRTGTTLLHRLLSCDANTNAVAWWESRNPAPFPGGLWGEADPRIARARREIDAMLEAMPDLRAVHPWDPEGPDEEFLLLEHSFYTFYSTVPINMPTYASWMERHDQTTAYGYLKLMLQFLQWQKRQADSVGERWVLKAPRHLGFLECLFEVFSDARIIQTHRDPLQTIPSVASMYHSLWQMVSDHPDPRAIGKGCKEHYARALEHCMALRDGMPPDRFLDIDYRAVVRDPLAAVRRIYDFLGLALTPDTEKEMRWWAEENRRDKREPHEYSLEDFGFTEEEIERDFREYRERFIAT
jgi:hypothetical protein